MSDDFLYTICCPSCGTVISKSFPGTKSYIRCSKCSAELFYSIDKSEAKITMTKEPKHRPVIPDVPA